MCEFVPTSNMKSQERIEQPLPMFLLEHHVALKLRISKQYLYNKREKEFRNTSHLIDLYPHHLLALGYSLKIDLTYTNHPTVRD